MSCRREANLEEKAASYRFRLWGGFVHVKLVPILTANRPIADIAA